MAHWLLSANGRWLAVLAALGTLCACATAPAERATETPADGWRVLERVGEARYSPPGAVTWWPVTTGQRIPDGSEIATGSGGRLIVAMPGRHISVGPSSHFRLPSPEWDERLEQRAGWLRYRMADAGAEPFRVHTRSLELEFVVTVLDVRVEQGAVEVTVKEGEIRLATPNGFRRTELAAGQSARAGGPGGGQLALRRAPGEALEPVDHRVVASTDTAAGRSFEPELELADLLAANGGDGTRGFALNGGYSREVVGYSVAGTGDINGDGIDDLVIGARGADLSGRAYVVFGTTRGFPAELELADLLAANGGEGTLGFVLHGVAAGDQAGHTVAGAGDVNGDGIDDVILNAPFADPNDSASGQAYVVFGTDRGFPAELELAELLAANGGDGTRGFVLNGAAGGHETGYSVAGAGDVNGDGTDDLILSAPQADPDGPFSGQAYVVFGTDRGFPAELELADLLAANGGDGTRGFALNGATVLRAGDRVAGTGDVNGDGIDDLILGAPQADPRDNLSGQAYVVFGTDQGFPAELELADLMAADGDGRLGFALNGALGVAGTRDVNGDGIDDLILGVPRADPNGNLSGQAYVVFGTDRGFPLELELADLLAANGGDGRLGFALNGAAGGHGTGYSVAGAGDVNGDGTDDLILGAPRADPNGNLSGRAYVVFGRSPAAAIERLIAKAEAAGLPGGLGGSLTRKLGLAQESLARN